MSDLGAHGVTVFTRVHSTHTIPAMREDNALFFIHPGGWGEPYSKEPMVLRLYLKSLQNVLLA